MNIFAYFMVLLLTVVEIQTRAAEDIIFFQNFDNLTKDKIPDEIIVVDGKFSVKSESNNKYIELEGAPLDNFGILFGPEIKSDVSVTARFFSESTGKRLPSFCIGLYGISGIKLRVSPGRRAIEILNGDQIKSSAPFEWKDNRWIWLNLIVRKNRNNENSFLAEGVVWYDKDDKKYFVRCEFPELPPPGKASVWGIPYSTKPIKIDDLKITKISE